ncbi:MAG TPA: M20/M25/M40 family metallo-hydrolase [Lachnospiraceae bacterium]|nr:M20/M25/M40 family metallo-hydrolase [Lachnospiraceae bacterium]
MDKSRFEEIEELTKKLVGIPSINGTEGEREIGEFLYSYIREIPYFKEHPEHLYMQELKDDRLKRKNVFALVKGRAAALDGSGGNTILFHGHIDTVGVQDFGKLSENAFSPDTLMEKLREMDLPPEVKQDLETGDYMFGRGACDMKSGDAVFLVLLKEFAAVFEKLKGNLLFSFNPVEENAHTGIIRSLAFLNSLKEKEKLNYLMAINNDYICPLYPGDTNRYVYTGAVGKILPCFYIQGKETHVGQCFEGVDASMLASILIRNINENPAYSDGYEGEYTLPPSVLKVRDGKKWYNVQTAKDAFLYFNYFIHNASMEEILEQLVRAGKAAFEELEKTVDQRYREYCELAGIQYSPWKMEKKVYTYQELFEIVWNRTKKADREELLAEIERIVQEDQKEGLDDREISAKVTSFLLRTAKITWPCIVIFFAPPYCPHNTLSGLAENEKKIKEDLKKITDKTGEKFGEQYQILNFFPSLSDSSYLKLDDSPESIECLVGNFPQQKQIYPIPFEEIRKMNIPAVNYGCYGKDAHKWTERVYKPYSFGVLPELIRETVTYYLM